MAKAARKTTPTMQRYRLRKDAGNHNHYGTTYHGGDIIESEDDLTAKFTGKFERLDGDTGDAAGAVEVSEDVTSKFPKAKEAALQVLKFRNMFYIMDDGEQLTMTGLAKPADVNAWVEKYLTDDDAEA